jgi:hypothetical protein
MQNPLNNLSPEAFRDLKVRLVLFLVFGASTALLVWSIGYRLPDSDRKLKLQQSKTAEFEKQTGELEWRWKNDYGPEAEQVATRFKLSQEQLLTNRDEFASWQADLKRQADLLAVTVSAGVARTQECPLPGKRFAILSAKLDVRPVNPGTRTNSPYLRLLNFAQNISAQHKRADLMELRASGNSNSVSEAQLDLHLWSLENVP